MARSFQSPGIYWTNIEDAEEYYRLRKELEEQKQMATGDPFCPTHGQTPCWCYMQTTEVDWSYKPLKDTAGNDIHRWIKDDYNDYTQYVQNYIAMPVFKIHAHDRWTRMRMLVDEDWESLAGIKELTHYTSGTEYRQTIQGYWPSQGNSTYTITTSNSTSYDPYANYSSNKIYITKGQ